MITTIRVVGAKRVENKIARDQIKFLHNIENEGIPFLTTLGNWIVKSAKLRAPRKTGALAEGITMRITDNEKKKKAIEIESTVESPKGVEYGKLQERGFEHYKSGQLIRNPYMVPAVESARRRIPDLLKRHAEMARLKTFGG